MDGLRSVLRDLQVGQDDMEGEGPALGMSGAVLIRIGIDDVALTAVEAGAVDGGGARCERVAAGAGDRGQGDAVGGDLRETADGGLAAGGGDVEVFRRHMVGVGPGVVGVVDRVGIYEGGVAASVGQGAGVDAWCQGDGVAAVGDDGQGGRVDVGDAVDGGVGVVHGRKGFGLYGIDELPRIPLSGAVGVGVAVGDGAVSVGFHADGRVARVGVGDNLAAAGVVQRGGRGCGGLTHAVYGGASVLRDLQAGQDDMEGEGPVLGMSGAVLIRIGIDDVALAAVEVGAVDRGSARRERVAAGVGDRGQGDAVGGDLRQAADSDFSVLGGNIEVFRGDMVGVAPNVVGAVDVVGIDEGGVTATVHDMAGVSTMGEGDGVAAVEDDGQCGLMDFG